MPLTRAVGTSTFHLNAKSGGTPQYETPQVSTPVAFLFVLSYLVHLDIALPSIRRGDSPSARDTARARASPKRYLFIDSACSEGSGAVVANRR